MKALIIGGTGPTGHFLVNGLCERGYQVAMLHSGAHEIPEIPESVEHIHTDAYSGEAVAAALGSRTFDLSIVTYGRLRVLAELLKGRTGRFLSVGGVPVYRGYMAPEAFEPAGIPIPIPESAPLADTSELDEKGWRIARTEEALFEYQPEASHFRYPYVYGPYQLLPREWCIVRRILDRRPAIILPEDGLTLHHFGYAENLAHAILLAVDQPEEAAGEVFNCADEEVLSLRQVVEVVASALDHQWEIVSMPWRFAKPARPMVGMPHTHHRFFDLSKLKEKLGYRDKVPAREALAHTARWLAEHPHEKGGPTETILQDPFDYATEDQLIAAWKKLIARMPDVTYETEPGYNMAYSGPGGRGRSSSDFE